MLVTLDGFVTDFTITSANVDDRKAIWDLVDSYRNIVLIGDKGYTSKHLLPELKTEKGIDLLPVSRSNSN